MVSAKPRALEDVGGQCSRRMESRDGATQAKREKRKAEQSVAS